ncbi:MAG: type II toxin-antitoxin system HicB family antitoxin [Cellulomonas sp.]
MNTARELLRLTPVYKLVENGWTQAGLLELPGVITAAPSRDEAQEMLVDALRQFLRSFGTERSADWAPVESGALTLTVSIGTARSSEEAFSAPSLDG